MTNDSMVEWLSKNLRALKPDGIAVRVTPMEGGKNIPSKIYTGLLSEVCLRSEDDGGCSSSHIKLSVGNIAEDQQWDLVEVNRIDSASTADVVEQINRLISVSPVVGVEDQITLAKPIEDSDWSVRTYNNLRNADISTLGQLVLISERELLKTRGFGSKSLKEIRGFLGKIGLTLADDQK
jgi:hypothetical protein